VRLEHDNREIAVPVEELMDPETCPKPGEASALGEGDPLRGLGADEVKGRTRGRRQKLAKQDAFRGKSKRSDRKGSPDAVLDQDAAAPSGEAATEGGKKKRRRRRKKGANPEGGAPAGEQGGDSVSDGSSARSIPAPDGGSTSDAGAPSPDGEGAGSEGEGGAKKRRRRRRRRSGKSGGDAGGSTNPGGGDA
jgi:hypothetical protein